MMNVFNAPHIVAARPRRPFLPLAFLLAAGCAADSGMPTSSAVATQDAELVTRIADSFGFVQSVRELPDGRVLVADPLGGLLVRLDITTGAMENVGREGSGPGEWRQPDAVHPMPGDSTLLVDIGNTRLTIMDPAGTLVDGYSMLLSPAAPSGGGPAAGPPALGMEVVNPRATDDAGRIYYQGRTRPAGPGGPASSAAQDSLEIRVWERGQAAPARLAGLRPPATNTSTSGGSNAVQVIQRPVPLAPQDDWAVSPDGRVAIVRAEPYRIEWLNTDGSVTAGPAVSFQPVPVGDAEKERWTDALGSAGLSMMMTAENGNTSVQMRRGGGGGMPRPQAGEQDYEWPATLPAFRPGAARVDPQGRVWVERYGRAGDAVVYDVFDADAKLSRQIRFPADRRLVGFGRAGTYMVHIDALGLHWLEVYRPHD